MYNIKEYKTEIHWCCNFDVGLHVKGSIDISELCTVGAQRKKLATHKLVKIWI